MPNQTLRLFKDLGRSKFVRGAKAKVSHTYHSVNTRVKTQLKSAKRTHDKDLF